MGLLDALRGDRHARQAALVGAGKRVELSDATYLKKLRNLDQQWQGEAWLYADEIGELKYSLFTVLANAMSQVRFFVAAQPEPDQEPVNIADLGATERPVGWREAEDEMARLRENSPEGIPGLANAASGNLSVPGEYWLVGTDLNGEDELFDVRSTDEVRVVSENEIEVEDENGGKRRFRDGQEDVFFARMHRRHPRKAFLADSNMRGVLRDCRKLLVLSAHEESALRSRMSAPILAMSRNLDTAPVDPTRAPDDQGDESPFFSMVTKHVSEPSEDDGSPSAVAPLVIMGDREDIAPDALRWVTLDRPLVDPSGEQERNILRRIGNGLNIPVEMATQGADDLNHWNAFWVRENFQQLTKPHLIHMVMGWTTGFLRPSIKALGVDEKSASQLFIWFDPTPIMVRPNQVKDYAQAHERFVVSNQSYRDAIGATDDEAPSPEEIEERIRIEQAIRSRPAGETPGETRGPPESDQAVTGAATSPSGDITDGGPFGDMGRRLAAIDRSLLDRVQMMCDAAVRDALRLAGARLRSKAQSQHRTLLAGVPAHLVAETLGRERIQQLGVEEDELLTDAFDDLHGRWDSTVSRSQQATLGVLDVPESEPLSEEQAEDRERGWTALAAALGLLARDRLFGTPPTEALGEFDPDTTVPVGTVRHALSLAGGAQGTVTKGGAVLVDGEPAGLVATGINTRQLLARHVGAMFGGQIWDYGDPGRRERPFEPHLRLDGLQFERWDDPRLISTTPWIPGYYGIADHSGCACIAIPVVQAVRQAA